MHVGIEKAAAWCGIGVMSVFGVAFWAIAGFIPPLSPNNSAEEIAATYSDHDLRIRIGFSLLILVAAFFIPFLALLARQVRRVEGYWGVMSISQVMAGVIFPVGFIFPAMVAVAAAFRPDRVDPEITQALNDVFWLMFVGIVGTLILQAGILAAVSFIDRRENPVFPRWFGYFNIWYAILAAPGGVTMMFHTGPLAWNGAFAFWVPLVAFSAWMLVLTLTLVRSVDHEVAERATI